MQPVAIAGKRRAGFPDKMLILVQFEPFGGMFGHPCLGCFFFDVHAHKLHDLSVGLSGVDHPTRINVSSREGRCVHVFFSSQLDGSDDCFGVLACSAVISA
jgi:hypothetical protein